MYCSSNRLCSFAPRRESHVSDQHLHVHTTLKQYHYETGSNSLQRPYRN